MSELLLEQHEKDRFCIWLEQQAKGAHSLAREMRKLGFTETFIDRLESEELACRIIASLLLHGEIGRPMHGPRVDPDYIEYLLPKLANGLGGSALHKKIWFICDGKPSMISVTTVRGSWSWRAKIAHSKPKWTGSRKVFAMQPA